MISAVVRRLQGGSDADDTSRSRQAAVCITVRDTATSKAKPADVLGGDISGKVGDPAPAGLETDFEFLGLDARAAVAGFSGIIGGKSAHCMAR